VSLYQIDCDSEWKTQTELRSLITPNVYLEVAKVQLTQVEAISFQTLTVSSKQQDPNKKKSPTTFDNPKITELENETLYNEKKQMQSLMVKLVSSKTGTKKRKPASKKAVNNHFTPNNNCYL